MSTLTTPLLSLQSVETIKQSVKIHRETLQLVSNLIQWCAYSIFISNRSEWFLDELLHIHLYINEEIKKWPCVVRTNGADKQKYSLKKMTEIRDCLERNVASLIIILISKEVWEDNRINTTAACLAVTQVIGHTYFLFNYNESIACELSSKVTYYNSFLIAF